MSILARIRANGGDVVLDRWEIRLRPGKMTDAAIAWVKAHKRELLAEIWPEFDRWEERAAIREYDGGLSRADAEQAAYAEVMAC